MSHVPTLYLNKHNHLYRIKVIGKTIWCERQLRGKPGSFNNEPVCEVADPRLKGRQLTDGRRWDLAAARIVLDLYDQLDKPLP